MVFEWPRKCDYSELPMYKRALKQLGLLSVTVNACAVGADKSAQVWRFDSPPGGVLGRLLGLRCRPEWGHRHASCAAPADTRSYPPLLKKKILAAWQSSVDKVTAGGPPVFCCAPVIFEPEQDPGADPGRNFPEDSQSFNSEKEMPPRRWPDAAKAPRGGRAPFGAPTRGRRARDPRASA